MRATPLSHGDRYDAVIFDAFENLSRSAAVLEARNYVAALELRRARWCSLRDRLWPRAISVSLCTAMAITLVLTTLVTPTPSDQVIASTVGERRKITLPDGSHVMLDTDSAISIRVTARERRVFVLKGRASFAVAHDPFRPFRVATDAMTVTAIGTDFDVSTTARTRSVTLVHGRVSVTPFHLRENVKGRSFMLSPGQQMTLTRSGVIEQFKTVDLASTTAWRQGRLEFTQVLVADAIAQANRYSTLKIRLLDPTIGSEQFDGSFRVGQTADLANALCEYFDLKIARTSPGEIFLDRSVDK